MACLNGRAGPQGRPARLCLILLPALLPALAIAGPALAQSIVPTASSADAPICTDRPTKSNFACTVPRGQVQIEADGLSWLSHSAGGTRTDQLVFTNPTVKYGLSDRADIQLNWVPFTRVRASDAAGNVGTHAGIGDLTVRFKRRLTSPDGAFQLALLPFVKLPTAPHGIGNGKVEGGLAVPINMSVPGGWTITLGPQIDLLASGDGGGRHLGLTGLINIARQIGRFTLYNELWTQQNFAPAGTVRQYSYDVALAWLASPVLQFDVGAHIGLNPATPDLVSYVGVSSRF